VLYLEHTRQGAQKMEIATIIIDGMVFEAAALETECDFCEAEATHVGPDGFGEYCAECCKRVYRMTEY